MDTGYGRGRKRETYALTSRGVVWRTPDGHGGEALEFPPLRESGEKEDRDDLRIWTALTRIPLRADLPFTLAPISLRETVGNGNLEEYWLIPSLTVPGPLAYTTHRHERQGWEAPLAILLGSVGIAVPDIGSLAVIDSPSQPQRKPLLLLSVIPLPESLGWTAPASWDEGLPARVGSGLRVETHGGGEHPHDLLGDADGVTVQAGRGAKKEQAVGNKHPSSSLSLSSSFPSPSASSAPASPLPAPSPSLSASLTSDMRTGSARWDEEIDPRQASIDTLEIPRVFSRARGSQPTITTVGAATMVIMAGVSLIGTGILRWWLL